jgi:hypothetical protein
LPPQLQHSQQLQAHWHQHWHCHHLLLTAAELQLSLSLLRSTVEQLVAVQGGQAVGQGQMPLLDRQQPLLVPHCVYALLLLLLPLKPDAQGLQMLPPLPCQSALASAQLRPRQD